MKARYDSNIHGDQLPNRTDKKLLAKFTPSIDVSACNLSAVSPFGQTIMEIIISIQSNFLHKN